MNALIELAPIIVSIAVGVGGLPAIVDYLKQRFNLQRHDALALSWAAAVVAGLVVSVADGVVGADGFSAENLTESVLVVWAASQVQYKRLQWRDDARVG